jgi:hypothetical protein
MLMIVAVAAEQPEKTVIVAVGTAWFIKENVRVAEGETPFESLRWAREPSAQQITAAIPERKKPWLYAEFECRGIRPSGRLYGCRISPSDGELINATGRRTLRLLKHYAVSRDDASRLRSKTQAVLVSLKIKIAESTDQGNCYHDGSCWVIPAPPPPPPPQASSHIENGS